MRILLDECVHGGLKRELDGHDVRTVREMGWDGIKNGKLLALAEQQFDAMITVDRNVPFQQNLTALKLALIVVHSRSIRWSDLVLHLHALKELLLTSPSPGLHEVGA